VLAFYEPEGVQVIDVQAVSCLLDLDLATARQRL
jgi:hypothetical protein